MRTRRRVALAIGLVALTIAGLASAQGTAQQPKPGPEHQQLNYFVGTWKYEGEYKIEPTGKYSGTLTCEFFSGGFHVVCRNEGSGVRGAIAELGIFGYSTEDRAYTWYAISRTGGGRLVRRGTRQGNTWTYEGEGRVDGKPAKYRYFTTEQTPTSLTYRWERSVEGGPWTVGVEVKGTKVK